MEEVDEFKSISSSDAKMDKDNPSKASEDGRELDIIEEKDEDDKEDIIMEEENEDFLSNQFNNLLAQYNRPYELFKRSNKTDIIPKKLLDKFQALLKKIKKRLSISSAVGDKSKFSDTIIM
jgi:hypothetical protein